MIPATVVSDDFGLAQVILPYEDENNSDYKCENVVADHRIGWSCRVSAFFCEWHI